MTPNLRDEITQATPFANLEAEAELNIIRTAAAREDSLGRLCAPFGISGTQYNALRILPGAASDIWP